LLVANPPNNEVARLEELKRLMILDSLPEPFFDEITLLASQICNTPMALISLVDEDRQWFKSKVGIEGASQTPRDCAFCAHAILEDKLFEIKDAFKDERFIDNPLVIDEPNIRFYAGMPISMPNGLSIGTLCVADTKPNALNKSQKETLAGLVKIITKAMIARANALNELGNKSEKLAAIIESANDAIISKTLDGVITSWNPAAERMFGYKETEMVGKLITSVFPMSKLYEQNTFTRMIKNDQKVEHFITERITQAGDLISVSVSLSPVKNNLGEIVGIAEITREVTDT